VKHIVQNGKTESATSWILNFIGRGSTCRDTGGQGDVVDLLIIFTKSPLLPRFFQALRALPALFFLFFFSFTYSIPVPVVLFIIMTFIFF
jgi:hypothetical protein